MNLSINTTASSDIVFLNTTTNSNIISLNTTASSDSISLNTTESSDTISLNTTNTTALEEVTARKALADLTHAFRNMVVSDATPQKDERKPV